MNTCYIFAGGEYDGFFDKIEKTDFVIAADKGYEYLEKENIKPNLIVGDFDSSKEPDFKKTIKLKADKDITDSYEAVSIAVNKGYKDIVIYGGLGGRISHTIANIEIAQKFKNKGVKICLKNKNQKIFLVEDKINEKFVGEDDFYVSIFSLYNLSQGVSIKGLKYELNDFCLENSNHIGVSNETVGRDFEISVKDGLLLVIYESKDNKK